MKHILIFFLLYAALISCSRKINTIEIDGIEVRPEVPPACVKIRDNFYADQTEVANVHYREYAYWIKGVYGDSSSTYRKTIVRNVQWVDVDSVTLQDMGYYFVHPMFNFYPILGISHDQAINYCKWRSDRVYEGILIREKIIRKEFPRDSSSCFTIERYQAGKFLDYKPDKKILTPRFRLPTENEWQLIAFGGLNEDLFPFGIDSNDKRVIRVLKKTCSCIIQLSGKKTIKILLLKTCLLQSFPVLPINMEFTIPSEMLQKWFQNEESPKAEVGMIHWKNVKSENEFIIRNLQVG